MTIWGGQLHRRGMCSLKFFTGYIIYDRRLTRSTEIRSSTPSSCLWSCTTRRAHRRSPRCWNTQKTVLTRVRSIFSRRLRRTSPVRKLPTTWFPVRPPTSFSEKQSHYYRRKIFSRTLLCCYIFVVHYQFSSPVGFDKIQRSSVVAAVTAECDVRHGVGAANFERSERNARALIEIAQFHDFAVQRASRILGRRLEHWKVFRTFAVIPSALVAGLIVLYSLGLHSKFRHSEHQKDFLTLFEINIEICLNKIKTVWNNNYTTWSKSTGITCK